MPPLSASSSRPLPAPAPLLAAAFDSLLAAIMTRSPTTPPALDLLDALATTPNWPGTHTPPAPTLIYVASLAASPSSPLLAAVAATLASTSPFFADHAAPAALAPTLARSLADLGSSTDPHTSSHLSLTASATARLLTTLPHLTPAFVAAAGLATLLDLLATPHPLPLLLALLAATAAALTASPSTPPPPSALTTLLALTTPARSAPPLALLLLSALGSLITACPLPPPAVDDCRAAAASIATAHLSEPTVVAAALKLETAAAPHGTARLSPAQVRVDLLTLALLGFGEVAHIVKPHALATLHALLAAVPPVRSSLVSSSLLNTAFAALLASAPLVPALAEPGVALAALLATVLVTEPATLTLDHPSALDIATLVDFLLLVIADADTPSALRHSALSAAAHLATAPATAAATATALAPSLPLLFDSPVVGATTAAPALFAALASAPELPPSAAPDLARHIIDALLAPRPLVLPQRCIALLLDGLLAIAARNTWAAANHFVSLAHVRWLVRAYALNPDNEKAARRALRAHRRAPPSPSPPTDVTAGATDLIAAAWPSIVDAYASPLTSWPIERRLIAGLDALDAV